MKIIHSLWGPITTMINAWVFQTLWNWFLPQPPLNIPPITYYHALGISTILVFVINMNSGTTLPVTQAIKDGTEDELFKHSFRHCITMWIICLGIGGLAYWAMP